MQTRTLVAHVPARAWCRAPCAENELWGALRANQPSPTPSLRVRTQLHDFWTWAFDSRWVPLVGYRR